MDDYTTIVRNMDGSYRTEQITSRIIAYTRDIEQESKQIIESFRNNLENQKAQVRKLTERILHEVKSFLEDIRSQEMQIEKLGSSITELDNAIQKNNVTYEWLNSLKRKIEEE